MSGRTETTPASSLWQFADWLRCKSCGRLYHPQAKTCGNYCPTPEWQRP